MFANEATSLPPAVMSSVSTESQWAELDESSIVTMATAVSVTAVTKFGGGECGAEWSGRRSSSGCDSFGAGSWCWSDAAVIRCAVPGDSVGGECGGCEGGGCECGGCECGGCEGGGHGWVRSAVEDARIPSSRRMFGAEDEGEGGWRECEHVTMYIHVYIIMCKKYMITVTSSGTYCGVFYDFLSVLLQCAYREGGNTPA